jgi:adenosylhomocysteine nucleosidase
LTNEKSILSNPLFIVALEVELPKLKFPALNIEYSGVGKINAAISAFMFIQKYKPSCVINFGSAGSLDKTISGLVGVDRVYQRDMDVRGLGFELGKTPFEKDLSEIRIRAKNQINLEKNVPIVSCSTGDNFVSSIPELSSQIVDMELYAIAKVCLKLDFPLFAWKFISDSADEDSPEDWESNVEKGHSSFNDIVLSKIVKNFGS